MNEPLDDHDTSFDVRLREQLHGGDEPGDAGFSMRVMAALPPRVSPQQRFWARWTRRAHWMASSVAACVAAALLGSSTWMPLDGPHAVAAAVLLGLLTFWSIPARWNRD
jgi:hypothetical protein